MPGAASAAAASREYAAGCCQNLDRPAVASPSLGSRTASAPAHPVIQCAVPISRLGRKVAISGKMQRMTIARIMHST